MVTPHLKKKIQHFYFALKIQNKYTNIFFFFLKINHTGLLQNEDAFFG